jgi:hypothetical protein
MIIVLLRIQIQEICLANFKGKIKILIMLLIWLKMPVLIWREADAKSTKLMLILFKELEMLRRPQETRWPPPLKKCWKDGIELINTLSQNLTRKTLFHRVISCLNNQTIKSHVASMKFVNQTPSTLIRPIKG